MDIWRLLGAALRRWYVFSAVVALSLLAAYGAGTRVQPEYTSGASVLLVPPVATAAGNPYADLGTAAPSVAIVLQSGPVRAELLRSGLSGDYEVGTVSRTAILRFTVRAAEAAVAVATAQRLIDEAVEELQTRQASAGVEEPFQVTVNVLEPAAGATESTRSQLQAQVAVFGVGAVLAFLAAVFLDDVVLLWRQRRRGAERADDQTSGGANGSGEETSSRASKPVPHDAAEHQPVGPGGSRDGR